MKKQSQFDRDLENERFRKESKREVERDGLHMRCDSMANEKDESPGMAYYIIKSSLSVAKHSVYLGVALGSAFFKGLTLSVNMLIKLVNRKNTQK